MLLSSFDRLCRYVSFFDSVGETRTAVQFLRALFPAVKFEPSHLHSSHIFATSPSPLPCFHYLGSLDKEKRRSALVKNGREGKQGNKTVLLPPFPSRALTLLEFLFSLIYFEGVGVLLRRKSTLVFHSFSSVRVFTPSLQLP